MTKGLLRAATASLVCAIACGGSATDSVRTDGNPPALVDSSGSWKTIAAGGSHTCGLTTSNRAYCWGTGSRGELGNGTTANSAAPAAVIGGLQFKTIYSGQYQSCGISLQDDSYCWGFAGSFADSVPTRVGGTNAYVSFAMDEAYLCGLTAAGTVYCWSAFGDFRSAPTLLNSPETFTSLVGGSQSPQICALAASGTAYCWGNWLDISPMQVARQPSTTPFVSLATNGNSQAHPAAHTCGLSASGAAYCWGRNTLGELGTGSLSAGDAPALVMGGLKFSSLVAMDGVTIGLGIDGRSYFWGGWLGSTSSIPEPFVARTFVQLSIGNGNICGVTARGAGYCWGRGPIGDGVPPDQLGTHYPSPIRVIDPP
jgi:alpha-tubulin suppressor-like RCC1 family protein